jgi:hypothetical protein
LRCAALVLALGLATRARAEDGPRLWTTEFGIGLNATQLEGAQNEFWQGRLLALRVVLSGVTVDARAQFTSVFPLTETPVRGSAELRLGYSGRRWAVVAGAYLLDGFNTRPRFLLLPSARGQLSLGDFSVVAGLWDFHLPTVPFHLSLESRDYGIGYVYPFGVEAHVRLRLMEFIGVTVQALMLQRPGGEVVAYANVMATLGVLAGKPAGPRTLIPPILDPTR